MSQAISNRVERSFDDAVRQYREDGFGVVRELFSPDEMAAIDAVAKSVLARADLIETGNLRCRWQTDAETGACVFDAFDPVSDIAPAIGEIAGDTRIHALLRAVYGEPGRLFKDKLIYKPPGASGYGLHQDYIAWPSFPRSFLTVIVAIDTADAQSGCTEVYRGYHEQGALTSPDGLYHEVPAELVDEDRAVPLLLRPGDAAFFSGFTPHRSGVNRSRRWRRQLYLSYNAESDGGDARDAHYREFHAWLRERYAEYGRTEVYFA